MEKENDLVPPEMPEAYHKARRQLCLFSAILIFWEYVGIRFGEKAAEPVIVKLPGADTKVRLENPEVIPVVIVLLVLYFSFRLTVEWKQSDINRRAEMASRVDLFTSYLLAIVSLVLFVFQQIFDFRLADFLTPNAFFFLSIGAFLACVALFFSRMASRSRTKFGDIFREHPFRLIIKIFLHLFLILFMGAFIYFISAIARNFEQKREILLIPYFIGVAIVYLIWWSYGRFKMYMYIRSRKIEGIPMEEIMEAWNEYKNRETFKI